MPTETGQDVAPYSDPVDRERLSAVALRAFRQVAERWGLSNAQAAAFLGVGDGMWDRVERGTWDRPLSAEQLTRVSAAIGVYQDLHLFLDDATADRWPTQGNTGPIFRTKSPVEAMIEGGVPTMLETRRYLDAVSAKV